jgi:hypothetical protein
MRASGGESARRDDVERDVARMAQVGSFEISFSSV